MKLHNYATFYYWKSVSFLRRKMGFFIRISIVTRYFIVGNWLVLCLQPLLKPLSYSKYSIKYALKHTEYLNVNKMLTINMLPNGCLHPVYFELYYGVFSMSFSAAGNKIVDLRLVECNSDCWSKSLFFVSNLWRLLRGCISLFMAHFLGTHLGT